MSSYYGDKTRDIPSWESFQNADDDEAVDQSEYQYAARDHILFCIDASQSMQTPYPDQENASGIIKGKSALHQALEAVVKIQRSKVITGPADSVGVLLWNVDSSKVPSSSTSGKYKPGTQVYQPLRTISAEEIKKIIKLMEQANEEYESQDPDEKTIEPPSLREMFPPAKKDHELNAADALVTCNQLFVDAGTKLNGNRRVFLVTDSDEPRGSSSLREPARTAYNDMTISNITINTFFIDQPNHRFDPTLYWNDILGRENDENAPGKGEEPDLDGLAQLADVMNDLVIRHAPKRVQFTIPLKFGGKDGEIEIGVSGYALVSSQGKGQPKLVRMRGQTVEEVQTKTEYTSAETGAVLKEDEIGQAYQFGSESTVKNVLEPNWWESDERQVEEKHIADEILSKDLERRRREDDEGEEDEDVEMLEEDEPKKQAAVANGKDVKPKVVARTRLQFTPDEIASFKSMGITPQIRILGFRSPKHLTVDENIKHSYFLYPNEAYTGSRRTFAALLQSCIKLDRHALALCRFKMNITPEICVLIPQPETFTKDGGQDQPPGFHVIVLPFVDDIRAPPRGMTDNLTANERQVKLMSTIVKRLKIKAGHYRSEAHPNPALAYHYAQLQALAFEEEFDETSFENQDKTKPRYAGIHKAAGEFMKEWNDAVDDDERAVEKLSAATKRAAVEPLAEEDVEDVAGAFKSGTIDKLKVADLKTYAKFKKISLAGKSKKVDIIEALIPFLEKEISGKKAKK